jgi:hypothetical protein
MVFISGGTPTTPFGEESLPIDYMFKGDSKINSKFYPPRRPMEEESPFSPITPGGESRMNISTFTTFLENNCMLRYYDVSGRDSSPSKTRSDLLTNKKTEESTFSTYMAKSELAGSAKTEKSEINSKQEQTTKCSVGRSNSLNSHETNETKNSNSNSHYNPQISSQFTGDYSEIEQNRMYNMNYPNNYNPVFLTPSPYSSFEGINHTPYPGVNMNLYDMMHHNAYMWNQPSVPFYPYQNMNPNLAQQNYPYQYAINNHPYFAMQNLRPVNTVNNSALTQKNEVPVHGMNGTQNIFKKTIRAQETNIRELTKKPMAKPNISHFATMNNEELIKHAFNLGKDQSGCRFLQKKIEEEGASFHNAIYSKIAEHTVELMNDSFGNYLIQKLLDFINNEKLFHIIAIVSSQYNFKFSILYTSPKFKIKLLSFRNLIIFI